MAIVPTTLRNQWMQELSEKFFLPATVFDARAFGTAQKAGTANPFEQAGAVVVCSYHFARARADAVRAVPWNLVVVDEAHRLRNVYKPGNKIARAIKEAIADRPKVLLTATPLQNTLLELFGLVGFLDEHLSGDIASFRAAYLRGPLGRTEFEDLRRRLAPLCKRTLRRQVTEYVRYTHRVPITQDFTPTDEEQRLYDTVSAYLQRDTLHALPASQRTLMTLVRRRLLASSTFAIAGTLASLVSRLEGRQAVLGPGVVFTESRRTQEYLWGLLAASGYAGQVMTLNGTNTDPRAAAIHEAWRDRHAGTDRVTGNRAVDLRTALVEHFRDTATILVATEAAAEGVKLQFCALVVNYDLPWNPQRIEQRIGRCHRYGQRHDVVVINFLNRRNEADQRVFQLLSEKFRLFDGVFGASDEVLGALESGVDFERRVARIYQSCRTPEQIDAAFDALQKELEEEIAARMSATRAQLLESFDEEVHQRLRLSLRDANVHLDRLSQALWRLTVHELADAATFDHDARAFDLRSPPAGNVGPRGRYRLLASTDGGQADHIYRLGHPLAQAVVERAAARDLQAGEVVFDYAAHPVRVSVVEALRGDAGYLTLTRVTIESLEQEDHLLWAAVRDSGELLDAEACDKLFGVSGRTEGVVSVAPEAEAQLRRQTAAERQALLDRVTARNGRFFEEEMEKLERWADDLKEGLERDIKEVDTDIRLARRDARVEARLRQKVVEEPLFMIRWRVA